MGKYCNGKSDKNQAEIASYIADFTDINDISFIYWVDYHVAVRLIMTQAAVLGLDGTPLLLQAFS
jgi:hypothetical protein